MKNLTTFIIDLQPEIVEALACIGSAVKTEKKREIKKALSNYNKKMAIKQSKLLELMNFYEKQQ